MTQRWTWGLLLLLIVAGIPATADTLTGRVVGVHDGDTLTLLVERQQVKVWSIWAIQDHKD